jgi:hypothetical protein
MWEKRTGSPVIYLQPLSIQYRMNSGTLLGEIAALQQALNLWPKRVKRLLVLQVSRFWVF